MERESGKDVTVEGVRVVSVWVRVGSARSLTPSIYNKGLNLDYTGAGTWKCSSAMQQVDKLSILSTGTRAAAW